MNTATDPDRRRPLRGGRPRRRRPAIRDSFAPDATWLYPGDLPISGLWQGRDAIVNDFLGGMGAFLDTRRRGIALVNAFAEGTR